MGIRIGIGSLKIGQGSTGVDWSSYWATLISATVENAAPTHVVLTFPAAQTSLLATDITATVNGVARTVSSASWTGAVWTVVLASAVEYGDVVVMTFKLTNTVTVTNNVLTYAALLTSTGTGEGVATMKLQVTADITLTVSDNAKFYSDAAGTLDESSTQSVTSGALRTIYFKCTTGTATLTFSDASKWIKWGDLPLTNGWISLANAPSITVKLFKLNLTILRAEGKSIFIGAFPDTLSHIYFGGAEITWVNDDHLPKGLTFVSLSGNLLNWTGLNIGDTGNYTTFNLANYRVSKMSSADMITLLTQMTNRAGTLPAIITINDYADYASPPQAVVDAVAALKTAKSITTVNLGA